ncbi:phosphoribosylanthranilate isomerase [Candidatus Bathyarchaeota archaeon]|nr:phosphoribosylanthranilate isomerase [Candidatus Bathyarchaeota archaeon]
MNKVRVKICGITNKEDLYAATVSGADAIGFIVGVESSPRNLLISEAKKLIKLVPLFVNSVVVTTNENLTEIIEMCRYLQPNCVQIHGNSMRSDLKIFKKEIPNLLLIGAIKAKPYSAIKEANEISTRFDAILIDSYIKGKSGGTGVVHNWKLSLQIKEIINPTPLILAGGLKPENVANAIRDIQPYAVDVSSGVEKKPGIKDHQKIYTFIKNAKSEKNE